MKNLQINSQTIGAQEYNLVEKTQEDIYIYILAAISVRTSSNIRLGESEISESDGAILFRDEWTMEAASGWVPWNPDPILIHPNSYISNLSINTNSIDGSIPLDYTRRSNTTSQTTFSYDGDSDYELLTSVEYDLLVPNSPSIGRFKWDPSINKFKSTWINTDDYYLLHRYSKQSAQYLKLTPLSEYSYFTLNVYNDVRLIPLVFHK